jgi:hypothetical protein
MPALLKDSSWGGSCSSREAGGGEEEGAELLLPAALSRLLLGSPFSSQLTLLTLMSRPVTPRDL